MPFVLKQTDILVLPLIGVMLQPLYGMKDLYAHPMFVQVKQADLVVVADAHRQDFASNAAFEHQWILKPIEILKGSSDAKEIRFPKETGEVFDGPNINNGIRGVILKHDKTGEWTLMESYDEAALPALRCMVGLVNEKDEAVMLRKLASMVNKPDAICKSVVSPYGDKMGFKVDFLAAVHSVKDHRIIDSLLPDLPGTLQEEVRRDLNH